MPIITLPSTAKDGSVSRIVPSAPATEWSLHGDVHYVITEHGVAYLHGNTIRSRAEARIAVVDPRFRDGMEREAAEVKLLPPTATR